MKLPKLTPSQWRSLATGTLAIAVTLNQAWLQIAGTPGIHIPPAITGIMQVVGILVAMGSRSLSKKDSGTGTGIVGDPACAVPGDTTAPAPTAPAPAFAGLMPSLIGALAPVGQLLLTAYAADLVAKQHQAAASEATQLIDQSALLAAHAKIDAQKIDAAKSAALTAPVTLNAQSPPVVAETPTAPLLAPYMGISVPYSVTETTTGGIP